MLNIVLRKTSLVVCKYDGRRALPIPLQIWTAHKSPTVLVHYKQGRASDRKVATSETMRAVNRGELIAFLGRRVMMLLTRHSQRRSFSNKEKCVFKIVGTKGIG